MTAIAAAFLFEVMDKELPLWAVCVGALILPSAGYFSCRRYRWTVALFVPLSMFFSSNQFLEITDPFVGPAIRAEAGLIYVVVSWVAIAVAVLAPIVGAAQRRKNHPVPVQ